MLNALLLPQVSDGGLHGRPIRTAHPLSDFQLREGLATGKDPNDPPVKITEPNIVSLQGSNLCRRLL